MHGHIADTTVHLSKMFGIVVQCGWVGTWGALSRAEGGCNKCVRHACAILFYKFSYSLFDA